ncbi:MAG: restriction endonuclease subunit S [Candidatus Phytoplasma sp. TWB_XP]
MEEEIQSLQQGDLPAINAKILKKIKIQLPPLETQNKIATLLEKINTTNSLMKDLLNKTDEQKQYLFNKLLF